MVRRENEILTFFELCITEGLLEVLLAEAHTVSRVHQLFNLQEFSSLKDRDELVLIGRAGVVCDGVSPGLQVKVIETGGKNGGTGLNGADWRFSNIETGRRNF